MAVYVHHYELWPRGPGALNARTAAGQPRRGALIRVGNGYGCLHPWTELGDLPLDAHLASLASGHQLTVMAQQALHCCHRDEKARQAGISLFEGKTIPLSHATLPSLPEMATLQALADEGFTHAKLKLNGNDASQREIILRLAANSPLKLRLDANGTLPLSWLADLDSVTENIEFIEDPVPYDEPLWTQLSATHRLRLAVDWYPHAVPASAAAVRIFKPAAQPVVPCEQTEIVITSLMDHPVGQAYAALVAAETMPPGSLAGLQTHRVYEPNAFSELLAPKGPVFQPPAGPGLGFGELLEKLPWKRLP